MNVLERVKAPAAERRWPTVKPRDSATLILLDRSGKVPKILMGRRHAGHRFMPGKFVFPGGAIEPADGRMVAAGALDALVERHLMTRIQRPTARRARALALAAIRETFEETGLLLGTAEHGAPDGAPPGPWAEFAAHGVYPVLETMHFVARAITPTNRPKRFDSRFFAADANGIAKRVEGVIGPDSELVELVWVSMNEARDLDLPDITHTVLDELKLRIDAGFGHHLPVPFFFARNQKFRREEI